MKTLSYLPKLLLFFIGIPNSHAQIIYEDHFDYSTTLDQNGWIPYAGVNTTALATTNGLNYPNYPSVGNAAYIRGITGQDVYTPFSLRTLVYGSFLLQVTENANKAGYITFFSKKNADNSINTQYIGRIVIKSNNDGTFKIGATNNALTNTAYPPVYSVSNFNNNQVYLIYIKFDIANSYNLKIWVKDQGIYNTETDAGPPDVSTIGIASAGSISTSVDAFAIRQDPDNVTVILDELRLFDNWNPETLPLHLLKFEAKYKSNSVQLNWTTTNEINVSHFEIEKSIDANHFETITYIKANNIPTIINEYQYIDEKTTDSINYYRLKNIDFDGRFTYSSIIQIKINNTGFKIGYLGNKKFSFFHPTIKNNSKANIYNSSGICIKTLQLSNFSEKTEFELSNYPQGIYWLKFFEQNRQACIQFSNN
ncbi:hypothetical protein [Rhizosphaericola mali]|uniref:T9SS type A sorting domain-containing protein n=1 Tax=Rhizosphaericola mali TaxID=2545455 RepID=A0A5P2G499_9BACT|nr:hypothetical protein [Rhizosphaericola mali]QES89518.1 hypothetical protein E0W69_012885 [Rhizosphaericola mali]